VIDEDVIHRVVGGVGLEVACNLPGLVAVRDSREFDGARLVVSRET